MATAQTATPATTQGENTGRWTAEEHRLFLQGLEEHGKGWKKIASLIKSRTVVQIRTHAQKYFQKLAKARQNGEEGDVSMENRERSTMSGSSKRRRSGTKRKAISSVVASAEREGKRRTAAKAKAEAIAAVGTKTTEGSGNEGCADPTTFPSSTTTTTTTTNAATQNYVNLPTVTPALAPFVYHVQQSTTNPNYTHHNNNNNQQHIPTGYAKSSRSIPSITTPQGGTISGAELEQSLFRFLTPNPNEPMEDDNGSTTQVNDIARQAGANPITVPSSMTTDKNNHMNNFVGGDVSPTGVADINAFPPSWVFQNVEPPTWYTKGADVDELLNEAEALDWLADSGDYNEGYAPPPEDFVLSQQQQHQQHQQQQMISMNPNLDVVTNTTTTISMNLNEAPSSQLSEPSLLSLGTDTNHKIKVENQNDDTIPTHMTTVTYPHQVPTLPEIESTTIVPKTFSNQDVKGISPTPSALNIPPLPSFFGSSNDLKPIKKSNTKPSLNSLSLFGSPTEEETAGDPFLDAQFDEQAFVTALLDQDGNNTLLNPHQ